MHVEVHHALGSVCEHQVLGVVPPGPPRVLVPQRLLRLQVVLCDDGLLCNSRRIWMKPTCKSRTHPTANSLTRTPFHCLSSYQLTEHSAICLCPFIAMHASLQIVSVPIMQLHVSDM